ncbi:MAG: pantoate--beta-alanine ligase [Tatlockia sp.]|jgi:pantoate--beta-alanine ligase
MQIFHHLNEWQAVRNSLSPELSIGFIPTMGNLHAGHARLYALSKQENDVTIASLFINPTQFNRADDFRHYPRTLEADLQLLAHLGVDYCFLPKEEEIYRDHYRYQIQETHLSLLMEGEHRPGHFTGVLTVVMKLLHLARPTRAYFGEKDYQQYRLIHEMVRAFFMDVEIKACPTVREPSGLAFSSRNNRLNPEQRALADAFAALFHQPKTPSELVKELENKGITVEYIEEYQGRRYCAVIIGGIRLIDNYALS